MKMILTACFSVLALSAGQVLSPLSEVYAQNTSNTTEEVYFSEQELDQMLAPIALYPDTVLAHILIAATYPLEVVQAARWVERNSHLEGEDALQAVEDEDWDPSVKALVPFPDLLQRMSDELDWTQRLGDAFLDDEALITERIQTLRRHAYDEGNLNSLEHLNVVKEKETIVIEPAVREVVYVPYYDTRYVYGPWWWDSYPPVYWRHRHHHYSHATFYWGPRVHLSTRFWFSGFHWHNHHIVVIDRHYHRSHRYYTSRQVVRHNDSRRWHHNPRHRRGVDYRNPRTRDYFENRRYESRSNNGDRVVTRNQSRESIERHNNPRSGSELRAKRDVDSKDRNLRSNRELRNAEYVRNKLNRQNDSVKTQPQERANRNSNGDNSRSRGNERSYRTERNESRRESVRTTSNERTVKAEERSSVKLREKTSSNNERARSERSTEKKTTQRAQRESSSSTRNSRESDYRRSSSSSNNKYSRGNDRGESRAARSGGRSSDRASRSSNGRRER